MQYIRINNWENFQQYKDRRPTWIKLLIEIIEEFDADGNHNKYYSILDNANLTSKHFKNKKDFVYYSSAQDAIHKIKYYLSHPKIMKKIATSSQLKTFKFHTYDLRAKELIEIIRSHPKRKMGQNIQKYFNESIKE